MALGRRRDLTIAVIGAGMGGVACAVDLHRAGFDDVTVFEKAPAAGGVWWHNTYPGCEVDVESQAYSYSFMRYDWTRTHGTQAQVQEYIDHVIDHFALRDRFRFSTAVRTVRWDDATSTYSLDTDQGAFGPYDLVVSCLGMLSTPNKPTWPGIETFQGPVFHTAEYEHHHDLTGKRVALVGTGSTAAQLAPNIAKVCSHLDLYQREAGYVLPKKSREFTTEERSRLREHPMRHRIERYKLFHSANKAARAFAVGTEQQEFIRNFHAGYLAHKVESPELREALTPLHPYGCKRPIFDSNFYPMFNRDNVTLVPRAVTAVTPNGVIDADGVERPADVLITATGFQATNYQAGLDVIGPGGRSLHEVWDGEPYALLGMTVPGFPNFFMLYGPNTNGGWSICAQLERQAETVARAAGRLARGRHGVIDTRARLTARYDAWLQRRLHHRRSALEAGCHNYFHTASGKNATQWPYPSWVYLIATRTLAPIGTVKRRSAR